MIGLQERHQKCSFCVCSTVNDELNVYGKISQDDFKICFKKCGMVTKINYFYIQRHKGLHGKAFLYLMELFLQDQKANRLHYLDGRA